MNESHQTEIINKEETYTQQVKQMNEQFESKVAKKEAEHAKVLESLEIEKQNQQEVFN